MWIVYWALAFAIIVVSISIAVAIVRWSYRSGKTINNDQQPDQPAEHDIAKSFENDLATVRSLRFGRSMHPDLRRVPERFRKE